MALRHLAALVLLTLTTSLSCSLILDLESCSDHSDCDEGFVCSTANLCIDSSAQCATDGECSALFGAGATCEDGICQGDNPLTDGPCQQLYGAVDDDDALLFGVIMQLSGVGGGFGRPMLDAMRIAKRDINAVGGVNGRPIGLVACDTAFPGLDPADYGEQDASFDAVARIAARHLVDVAEVPAIIGLNSSQVLDIGPTITSPNDVLLMSPSATAATIPPAGHDGLIWRTAPSDEPQAFAMSELIKRLLDDYFPAQGSTEPKVTVLIRDSDRWAEGLFDHLLTELPPELTGGGDDRFSTRAFPNIAAGDFPEYEPVAAAVAAEPTPADLIVVLGSADSWEVITQVDSAVSHEPLYLGADAMKNVQEASRAPAQLEGRLWGTGPRSVAEFDYQPYTIFRIKFEREMNDNADNYQFVANAFDALYAVAFAAAADGFTGPAIAQGLTKLSDGEEIFPSSTDAQRAINTLSEGGTIDYQGASGPLNFDEMGNAESMPIALWCFENGQVPERGEIYDQQTDTFTYLICND